MRGVEDQNKEINRAGQAPGSVIMTSEPEFGVSLPRREDARLLLGKGAYTADLVPAGLCHAVFVRSPHGHARITRIDRQTAAAMRGVVAILLASDLAADGIAATPSTVDLKRPDGTPAPSTPRPLLVDDRVRHLGEPVAMVIALSVAATEARMDSSSRQQAAPSRNVRLTSSASTGSC